MKKQLKITAEKFELISVHKGSRLVDIPKHKAERYKETIIKEYENKGYTIHEYTNEKIIMRSNCQRFIIDIRSEYI